MKIFMNRYGKKIFFLFFMFLLSMKAAFAVDAEQFALRLKYLTDKKNISFLFSKVVADNKDIIISNISVIVRVGKNEEPLTFALGDIRFENVQEDENGNYLATRVYKENFVATAKVEDRIVTIENVEIKNLILPKGELNEYVGKILSFQELIVNNLIYNDNKKQHTASLENLNLKLNLFKNDVLEITFSEKNVNVPVYNVMINDQDVSPMLLMLGYERLVGDANFHFYYDGKTGNITLDDSYADFKDLGKLSFNMTAKIPSLELFKTIKKEKDKPDYLNQSEIENSEAFNFFRHDQIGGMLNREQLLILQLLNAFTLSKLEIDYKDYSFINRLFDLVEKQTTLKRPEIAAQAKMMFSQLGYFFNDKTFINDTAAKLEIFINDPQSINIKLDSKVLDKMYILLALAYVTPEDFIKVVDVSVTVNGAH